MTQEENAKAYTELINRLEDVKKAIKKQNYGIAMDILCKPYPEFQITTSTELKKSEDEKIRKALIKFHKSTIDVDGIKGEDVLAWLEKQGENNMGISEATKKKLEDNLNKALEKETPESCNEFLDEQGEQKPKFRVGDTIKCKYDDRQFTIKSVNLDKGTYTYTQEGCGNDIDYADEEFELAEQNPAWSEEDEDILFRTINDLKFLRDTISIDPKYAVNIIDTEREINWLNSLNSQSTWKPSEEHFELEEFAKIVRGNLTGISKVVQKLFEAKYLQLTGKKMYGGFKD